MAVPALTIIVIITEDLNLQKKSHTACKIVTFEIDNYIISICKDNDSISGDIIKLSDFDMKEIIKNLLRTE